MKLKRVLCMTLAVMMAVMTVGCGSKDGAGSSASSKNGKDGGSAIVGANKATHFFRAEYMENLPEDLVNLGRTFFAGEKFYYTSYGMEYDSPMVGCIDFTTGDSSVIWKAEAGNTDISVNNMCADKDGNIYIMTRLQRMKDDVLERYADTTEEDIIKYIYEDWGFDRPLPTDKWIL